MLLRTWLPYWAPILTTITRVHHHDYRSNCDQLFIRLSSLLTLLFVTFRSRASLSVATMICVIGVKGLSERRRRRWWLFFFYNYIRNIYAFNTNTHSNRGLWSNSRSSGQRGRSDIYLAKGQNQEQSNGMTASPSSSIVTKLNKQTNKQTRTVSRTFNEFVVWVMHVPWCCGILSTPWLAVIVTERDMMITRRECNFCWRVIILYASVLKW
jgi:hypothetical protein